MDADTPGKRLYLIRLACGDGVRTAETLKLFADRVRKETGAVYHPNTLSLLERDEQGWRLQDSETLSRVDPLHRGRIWLAFGEVGQEGEPMIERRLVPDPRAKLEKPAAKVASGARRRGR